MENTKICIIDDNEAVCDSLVFLFESYYDIKVKTFNDPLLFLQKFPPLWKGCLIIDLFMPSINGLELLKALKKENKNVDIIIITGHGNAESGAQCLAAGAYDFINKPFKTDYLLDIVNSMLSLRFQPNFA
jgi:FixJ family two-component response regulator